MNITIPPLMRNWTTNVVNHCKSAERKQVSSTWTETPDLTTSPLSHHLILKTIQIQITLLMKKDAQQTVQHYHDDEFELKMTAQMVKKRYGEMNQISRSLHAHMHKNHHKH